MRYDEQPKPPEWWTTENTEAWNLAQFGDVAGKSAAQVAWDAPVTAGNGGVSRPRTSPSTWTIAPEVMAQWRVNDPRPSASTYYDGTPITRYQPLRLKKQRKAKAA